jgi:hypothetical protein
VVLATTRQPVAGSSAQVTSCPSARQAFPTPPAQSGGAAPHEQVAVGAMPLQGFPAGQVSGVPAVMQPAASMAQLSTVWGFWQLVPA